jgi:nucleoside-diphosphate-sugar epimerase
VRVFLTGGTGLVGSHIAERLNARGDQVVALAREDSDTRFLERVGCTLAEGDVRDAPDDLARAMVGCDAVVHAAALVYVRGSWPRVRAVNVEGTTHVFAAASEARVPAGVHLSSVAVYGPARGPLDEDTALDAPLPPGSIYARSKREAEAAARREAASGGVRLTVLRPAAVYGERDRLMAPRVARLVRLPIVPVVGDGRQTLPIVYAGNVAAAVERSLDVLPDRSVRTYDLGLDHPLSQEGLILGMARALGRRPRLVHVPGGLIRAAAELAERVGLAVPGAGDLSMSRFARLVLEENPYRSRRIRDELGWNPPFGHDEGLARTAAWLMGERMENEDRPRGIVRRPSRGARS